ncbi:hypothetical protein HYU95_02615 [Candidatus Daviesbacteria bacterium]|nr:hypothetical protein [Candidatus Daviesbacteria bacterium]
MNLYKPVLILIIFLVSFLPSPVSASTLSNQVPWGARNNYNAFDGSGWDAFFNVSFPDFGPGVDIYAGTGGTAGSGPYPSDPAAYFNGFTAGQTITFRTTITNSSGNTGKDNFWFSVSKVIACPGFNLSSPTLTEQNLYDCSVAGNRILTNQQLVFWSPSLTYHHPGCATGIDGKFCLNISNAAPDNTAALTYTWTPTEAGYYQFDFGSDDYGHDYPGATAYAAGFLRVIPAPLPPPPPPPEGTKACSITSVSAGTSSTESSISYNGWGSTTTAEPVGLWVEKKVSGANPAISPAPQVNGVEVLPTISGSTYYYRLDSPGDCNATSTISCSASKSVILPVGEYWTHCDLPTNPASNPPLLFCSRLCRTGYCTQPS